MMKVDGKIYGRVDIREIGRWKKMDVYEVDNTGRLENRQTSG